MKQKMGRRSFLRNGAGVAAAGVTAAACGNGKSDSVTGLSGPSPIADGDRAITVVYAEGLEDVPLGSVRVRIGEPPTAERTTDASGVTIVSVSGATLLTFDTPLDNRCVPFAVVAGDALRFPLRLRRYGDVGFLAELHNGFIKRSIRPWHVKYSSELWSDPETRASIEDVVAFFGDTLRGFCTITHGMNVPRDVSLLDVYVDTTIDPKQYGAITTRTPAGGNVATGATVRYARPEFAHSRILMAHEFYHAIPGFYHVASVRSIMNISTGSSSLYTFADPADDSLCSAAARMAYRRTPGAAFQNGVESDRGIVVMSAATAGGEEVMCTCPPMRA
jgi:hypothetical protein